MILMKKANQRKVPSGMKTKYNVNSHFERAKIIQLNFLV